MERISVVPVESQGLNTLARNSTLPCIFSHSKCDLTCKSLRSSLWIQILDWSRYMGWWSSSETWAAFVLSDRPQWPWDVDERGHIHLRITALIDLHCAVYILTITNSDTSVTACHDIYVLLTECKILTHHSVNLPEALQKWLMLGRCKLRTGIEDSHCQTLQIHPFDHLRDLVQYIELAFLHSICESSTC